MIGHFPPGYSDETAHSILARFFGRVPHRGWRGAIRGNFPSASTTSVIDLPKDLLRIVQKIPEWMGVAVDTLVLKHTLWPMYSTFQSESKREESRSAMEGTGFPYLKLGLMASGCPRPRFLRFCSSCVIADRNIYRETYWHRKHQIPGVDVCYLHEEPLQESTIRYSNRSNRHQFTSAEEVIGDVQGILQIAPELDLWMARAAGWILDNPRFTCAQDEFRNWLVERLVILGLANWSGRIKVSKILREFGTRYDARVLDRIGCALEVGASTWIERMLHKTRGHQHPFRYLLMLNFVRATPREFFESIHPAPPFGDSPWPCLNHASDHYGEATISECTVRPSWNSRSLIASFHCLRCGMVYSRSGPDREPSDRMRRDHIPHFGPVWDSTLRRIWTSAEYSLRQVARQLGVDPLTAQLRAKRIGLNIQRPGYRGTGEEQGMLKPGEAGSDYSPSGLDLRRRTWLNLREQMPGMTINSMRRANPGTYCWLYRHDREWLKQHYPKKASRQPSKSRVNWMGRDEEISSAVVNAAQVVLQSSPSVRLTAAAVLRNAGYSWVGKRYFDRLPLTHKKLVEIGESRLQYALRRVAAIADQYLQKNEPLAKWKLIRKSGLRSELLREPQVAFAIGECLRRAQAFDGVTSTTLQKILAFDEIQQEQ